MSEEPLERARESIDDAREAVDEALHAIGEDGRAAGDRQPDETDGVADAGDRGDAAPGIDLGDGRGHGSGGPTGD